MDGTGREAMGKVRDEVEREGEGEREEGWNWEALGARAGAPKGGIIRTEKAALS